MGKLVRYAGRAVPGAIALVLVAGFAHATVPDSSGVIHACYAKSGGALKVIDTGTTQKCTSAQKSLTWNQSSKDIVVRARWTGSISIPNGGFGGVYETFPQTWTQATGEVDEVLPGTVTISIGRGCQSDSVALTASVPGYSNIDPLQAGQRYELPIALPNLGPFSATKVVTLPLAGFDYSMFSIFEPTVATARTLQVEIAGAASGCLDTGGAITVTAVSFDVQAVR